MAETLLGRPGWTWTHAPPEPAEATRDGLRWTCGARTDLWRITDGVETKHDGQGLLLAQEGDFTFEATFEAPLEARFDQVGVLVEADEQRWLKCGVELDDRPWLSAVHTHGASDWSREPTPGLPVRLGLERRDGTLKVAVHQDGVPRTFRVLHLPGPVRVGPYSCAPQGPGFAAVMRAARLG